MVRVLADKWAMPVMGWLSAADTLSQLTTFMSFSSKEEAIRVAERNGASVVCCRRAWQWCCSCQVECLLSPCCLVWLCVQFAVPYSCVNVRGVSRLAV